ncbi:MAG: flagellar basal body-associated FliL family protein [Caldimonas sp.]
MSAVIAEPARGAAAAARPGRRKLILIVAIALAVLLAAGGGAVWLLKKRAAQAAAEALGDDPAQAEAAHATGKPDARSPPVYLPLDAFVVNLADKESDRYAQIGITLELESSVFADQMKGYMPAVRNSILLILAHKTARELLGRAGKEELADEIMREAVRPMGIEIAAPEPVTPAPLAGASGVEKTAQDEAPARPRKKKPGETTRNPIQHVHFSSFIIQ